MARVPLYRAAETEMIRRIRSGEWAVGQRLPNEFGLADEFGVSQGTMRRALITLEGMGLLARKPGRGTIVAEPVAPTATAAAKGGLGAAAELTVFRAKTSTRGAGTTEAALFGTGRLVAMERVLKRGGERAALETLVMPEVLIPAPDEDSAAELVAFLAAHGVDVATIDDQITARLCTMGESVALAVDRNTALLGLTRIARDAKGAVLAQQILWLVADDIGYDVTLG